ncbi:unnamed protein product [Cylicocyclus nassatus]|uniref:Cytosolic fatty-acid binding proteins domain-containing protein n=1 Tax=Cylicocyclus nassatus TaxID=53992 RepID=A0AA36HAP4_CYLNA|nr:unnamed protein product [Cylicocyclus nassatus]
MRIGCPNPSILRSRVNSEAKVTFSRLLTSGCLIEAVRCSVLFSSQSRSVSVMNCLFVLALVGLAALVSAKDLPDKYYGKFDLDHSENFDEYLEAKGYGWFTRKLVTFATFKKEFTKSDKPGKFDYSNLTSKKDVHYKDVELGKEFVGEGLDSTNHKITFDLVGDKLFEKHHPMEKGEAKDETYEYSFVEKDGKEYLLVKMEANGVVGKRFYKRL